jgi:hypothetical protein
MTYCDTQGKWMTEHVVPPIIEVETNAMKRNTLKLRASRGSPSIGPNSC